jgi:hypothetical protein
VRLAVELCKLSWTMQPKLCTEPRLIGDASKSKNNVFVEVQFGNSATMYRDYYRFHYGLVHGLPCLTVLIVPTSPTVFFPTLLDSIGNMVEYGLSMPLLSDSPDPGSNTGDRLSARELAMALRESWTFRARRLPCQ